MRNWAWLRVSSRCLMKYPRETGFVGTWNVTISRYVRCRRMSCESNKKPDEATAGEFVMGIQYNRFNEAVALFQEMQTKRVKGDKFTAVALLTGCAPLGALEQGEWSHGNGKTSKGIELFSFIVVLTDCVHRGLADEGCEFFNSNRKIYEIERG
ncbi:pentatricopeptide repeat-containing protein [Pyrus ussuriensis x Pyrus communis]|uniref:Pentatricopeptide repeat-containing protein n=1 Tax=Pyrus ussuriensis x Pyrus communis TaxID=2448454 RepID=A0A5N5H6B1_9ROSA|nr:pentatricopeptide repeat-containing protein [Pyrus ussuriensis x Pyrus communis]